MNSSPLKICRECQEEKPLEEFKKDVRLSDGRAFICKRCSNKYNREHTTPEKVRESGKRYRDKNRDRLPAARRARRSDAMREYFREYRRVKRAQSVEFRLAENLRCRLNSAIKCKRKSGSAIKDLGCNLEELKRHLESKFYGGMSWDTWGKGPGKWNIHHVVPFHVVDIQVKENFLKVANFSNLSPIWYDDHVKLHSEEQS
jgi:hypothetical protein